MKTEFREYRCRELRTGKQRPIGSLILVAWVLCVAAHAAAPGVFNVLDYGAVPNDGLDDTAAIQTALNAAGAANGGIVTVPAGEYTIATRLTVPQNVTLQGESPMPPPQDDLRRGASVLMAYEGAGNAAGAPFITLRMCATLSRITVFYPNQIDANPPIAYPWTVAGSGEDNVSIVDVTLINPYQAVDFATNNSGRHFIDGLYAQALSKGVYVNKCFDVGRLRNIYLGPIWSQGPVRDFMRASATAYDFGRTDGEQAFGLQADSYHVAFRFWRAPVGTNNQPGAGVLTNVTVKRCRTAVLCEDVGDAAAWSFVNGILEGSIEIGSNQKGPMKFMGCSLSPEPGVPYIARLLFRNDQQKATMFSNCTFAAVEGAGAATIQSDSWALIVTGCTFLGTQDSVKVRLGANTKEAVVAMNRMQGGVVIENNAPGAADIQIGLNSGYQPPANPGRVAVNPAHVALELTAPSAHFTIFNQELGALDWEIAGAPGWLTVTPQDGSSEASVLVSTSDFAQARTATLTVTNQNLPTDTATVMVHVFRRGDIDRDSAADIVDVQLVINAALKYVVPYNCDLSGDGSVDALDVQLAINAALGIW